MPDSVVYIVSDDLKRVEFFFQNKVVDTLPICTDEKSSLDVFRTLDVWKKEKEFQLSEAETISVIDYLSSYEAPFNSVVEKFPLLSRQTLYYCFVAFTLSMLLVD
jgi:hypothetical protein